MDKVTVQITVKQFALIKLLESLNVFKIKNGSVTIHFDMIGNIGKVETHRFFRPLDGDKSIE